jgi:ERF superfamily protein
MTDAAPAAPRRRRANGQHPPPALVTTKPSSLLEAIIHAASDPSIDIAKVEHLVRLKKEMDSAEAERLFNEALAAAQAEMQPIVADAVNAEVGRAHRYASYAQLDRAVRPIYSRHGLSVTFNTGERSTDSAVEVTCYLCGHGHGRRYSIIMPADGKGAKGGDVMSRTHAAASAISYGMRYLLVMVFNLAIDRDDDGNAAGKVPSSAPVKRENVWAQFASEMRAAKSLPALQAVVVKWRPRVINWSEKWKDAAESLHGQCHARLSGSRPVPKEQAP